jgi:hypothetical protein
MSMIERHYCAHPLIPRGITHSNASDIWQESAKELYEYCYERDLIDLWVYFVDHWYRSDRWYLWARSSFQSLLPMGKTTMMIEAHWKVLKRNHLYYYHRARLDTLVWVISTKHFPQQMYKWARLIARRIEASDWEKDFIANWNALASRSEHTHADTLYQPDTETWVCGCPAYAHSRFPLCKHLVKRTNIGVFPLLSRVILRRSTAPFVQVLLPSEAPQRSLIATQDENCTAEVYLSNFSEEEAAQDDEKARLTAMLISRFTALLQHVESSPSLGELRKLEAITRAGEKHMTLIDKYRRRRTLPILSETTSSTRYHN